MKKGSDDTKKISKDQEDKIPEVIEISTNFNENEFRTEVEVKLLKELKICDSTMTEDNNLERPSCSPRFFRFFPSAS